MPYDEPHRGAEDRLSVLLIDDSPEDAELVVQELFHGGFDVSFRRVCGRGELVEALSEGSWDIALNDYEMGAFCVEESLQLVATVAADLPVICVSGFVGEEVAKRVMLAGARDFVTKDGLERLCPTVRRELRDASLRAEHRQVQLLLHTCLQRLERVGSARATEALAAEALAGPVRRLARGVEQLEDSWLQATLVVECLRLLTRADPSELAPELKVALGRAVSADTIDGILARASVALADIRQSSRQISEASRGVATLAENRH